MIDSEEASILIQQHKTMMREKFEQYHQATLRRFDPVFKKMKKKRTKDGVVICDIDILATKKRMYQRLSRYSKILHIDTNRDRFFSYSILLNDKNEYVAAISIIPITNKLAESKLLLQLSIEITQLVITHHAVMRWLTRNNSKDVEEAIIQLGTAMMKIDIELAQVYYTQDKFSFGLQERQVKCKDGGIAFVKVLNPEEGSYQLAEMLVTTYISKEMVQNWNRKSFNAEFPNLENNASFYKMCKYHTTHYI